MLTHPRHGHGGLTRHAGLDLRRPPVSGAAAGGGVHHGSSVRRPASRGPSRPAATASRTPSRVREKASRGRHGGITNTPRRNARSSSRSKGLLRHGHAGRQAASPAAEAARSWPSEQIATGRRAKKGKVDRVDGILETPTTGCTRRQPGCTRRAGTRRDPGGSAGRIRVGSAGRTQADGRPAGTPASLKPKPRRDQHANEIGRLRVSPQRWFRRRPRA
jgi:hypothetical protein